MDVRKGKKGGGNSLPLEYIRERRMKSGTNEARVDCAGEWGAFVTGRIQSEILYRVSGFHLFSARASTSPPLSPPPRLLSPLQSPNLRFSRDFSASSKMKGSLSNLFQRSSLSTETVRFPPIFGLVFFFIFLLLSFFLSFFEHVLFRAEKSRGRISIFDRVIGLIRIISRIDRNTSLCFVLLENIDRSRRKF